MDGGGGRMVGSSGGGRMVVGLLLLLLGSCCGHGRLRQPPGRSTMWRYDFPTPENVNDHELNCGGFGRQQKNNGLCGVCGDPYDQPRPRDNELGGRFGEGVISAEYLTGQVLDIEVELTAYHQGFFEFRLCPHNTRGRPVQQACLDQHLLRREGGGARFLPADPELVGSRYWVRYLLPPGLTCSLCVLQWRYWAGNSWGRCGNGTESIGCGPQEEFRACADVAIHDEHGNYNSRPSSEGGRGGGGRVTGYQYDYDYDYRDTSTPLPAGTPAVRCSLLLLLLVILVARAPHGAWIPHSSI